MQESSDYKRPFLSLILCLIWAFFYANESEGDGNNLETLQDSIIVKEYPLGMNYRKALEKRARWRPVIDRDVLHQRKREAFNKKLADFDLELVLTSHKGWRRHYLCDLFHHDKLILEKIRPLALEVSESKTDFALVAENKPNRMPVTILMRKNGIQPFSWGKTRLRNDHTKMWITLGHAIRPVFLNDKLLSVEWVDTGTNNPATYAVKHGEGVLFSGSAPFVAINPVRALYAVDDHWILEVAHQVFIDGINLNQQTGCKKIFRYVFFKEKPLFFFEKNGKIHISYNGNTLPGSYQKVPHYPCCENPGIRVGKDMIRFFGLRDGTWYYVEMGVYRQ